MTKRLFSLLTVLGTLASGSAFAQDIGSFEPTPCPIPLPYDGEVEGETYDCGVVLVPEDHDAESGRTLELAVLRLLATTLSPRPDPVVYLAGGPGASGLHEFAINAILFQNMQTMRERRDVITYDQRGAGHSQLLACGPFLPAVGVLAETTEEVDLDEMIEIGDKAGLAFLAAICGQTYAGRGIDFAQYNSVASAKDIAMLANAMGYGGGYNLYGTSYGTRLAQHALRVTPDRVRAAIVDGTVSVASPGNAHTTTKLQAQYDTIFELCAADGFCSGQFPDLRNRFIAVLEDLHADPLVIDPPLVASDFFRAAGFVVVDRIGPDFFNRLGRFNNGAAQGGAAAFVPMLVDVLEVRDVEGLRAVMGRGTLPDQPEVSPPADAAELFAADDELIAPAITLILQNAKALAEAEDNSLAGDWMNVVVGEMNARLLGGEEQAEVIRDLVELVMVPLAGTDREPLDTFATDHLTPEAVARAKALTAAMTRQDVRATMWAIQDIADRMSGAGERTGVPGVSMGLMNAANCAEDVGLTPPEIAEAFIAETPYPGLGLQSLTDYRTMYAACGFFPMPFTKEEIMTPVTSDTPVLIFSEGMDSQTPVTQGALVQTTLPNSFRLIWPSEGHVIASRSPDGCAGAIAAAFLDDPLQDPDVTCAGADYYQVPFELAFGLVHGAKDAG